MGGRKVYVSASRELVGERKERRKKKIEKKMAGCVAGLEKEKKGCSWTKGRGVFF